MAVSASRARLLDDPYLAPYAEIIRRRADKAEQRAAELASAPGRLQSSPVPTSTWIAPRRGWLFSVNGAQRDLHLARG